ncbi:hypothetical protein I6A84_23335 [Frankia sp. CNm7]|uniref:Uncharacterized protein n=1 Tax=Frankia nepalensis TaxID=1836974 RepID=A0A937RJK7_9ACTN|nr:hypothetical protein [Frankia nepalensis]MBL7500051.1 hypothetical protein [Frankia nepalensis]MBL7511520.1 hypothetical protein [Frankia nepalensis]MBL7520940.1 hypothetical protein [Frankia nepalensis]MBL7628539.1 hypothetical protein [Frankia nepalensis]
MTGTSGSDVAVAWQRAPATRHSPGQLAPRAEEIVKETGVAGETASAAAVAADPAVLERVA